MEERRTLYPGYHLLNEAKEWDPHTREIVLERLGPFPKPQYLTSHEAELIKTIARHLVYDNRDDILNWVLKHIDQGLHSQIGEDQRKPGTPPAQDLIREGLTALDTCAKRQYGKDFNDADSDQQFDLISALQLGQAKLGPEWKELPQKDLFKKLAGDIVSAYYSHPAIWSEIGYGGPAYPRGYIRVELGLTDPWEAKRDG